MADKINLQVVTPDRSVLSEDVDDVVLPSVDGYMGVLPGHAPLLAQLDVGEVSYRVGSERRYMAISGGYAEVLRTSVSVLARTAEPAQEIDLDRAQQAKNRAEAQIKKQHDPHLTERAEIKLRRAISRIQVHGRR